jgi:hypothetical protein
MLRGTITAAKLLLFAAVVLLVFPVTVVLAVWRELGLNLKVHHGEDLE